MFAYYKKHVAFQLLKHLGPNAQRAASTHLLFGDAHVIGNIRENRRLNEKAFVSSGASSTFQLGAFFFPTLN